MMFFLKYLYYKIIILFKHVKKKFLCKYNIFIQILVNFFKKIPKSHLTSQPYSIIDTKTTTHPKQNLNHHKNFHTFKPHPPPLLSLKQNKPPQNSFPKLESDTKSANTQPPHPRDRITQHNCLSAGYNIAFRCLS